MILFFVLLLVLVGFALQKWMIVHGLQGVQSTYRPEENIVDAGEVFFILIEIENRCKWPIPYVKVKMYFDGDIQVMESALRFAKESGQGGGSVETSVWMRPGQQVELKIPVKISGRGRYVLSHPNLFGGDFLGLCETRREVAIFREVIAAPKSLPEQRIQELMGSFLGDISVRRYLYEDPLMTAGYREYTGREPMKQIDWKQSAHSRILMVKEYDHTVEPVLTVLLNIETDYSGTDYRQKEKVLEVCYCLARSVCEELENKGIKYVFCTNGKQAGAAGDFHMVREGLGHRHFLKILECLGRGLYEAAFSREKLLELAKGELSKGVVLITPFREDFEQCREFRHLQQEIGENLLLLYGCEIDGGENCDLDARP